MSLYCCILFCQQLFFVLTPFASPISSHQRPWLHEEFPQCPASLFQPSIIPYRSISTSLRPRQQALEEPAVPQQMPNRQMLSYCAHTRQRHNAAGSAGPVSRPEACGSDEPEGNRRVCPASRQYVIRQRCNGWWSTMQVGPAETKPVENGWRTIEM